jgi:hypothetical protein
MRWQIAYKGSLRGEPIGGMAHERVERAIRPAPTGQTAVAAAARALAEAEARRIAIDQREQELKAKRELNGRGGLDPVRYDGLGSQGHHLGFLSATEFLQPDVASARS